MQRIRARLRGCELHSLRGPWHDRRSRNPERARHDTVHTGLSYNLQFDGLSDVNGDLGWAKHCRRGGGNGYDLGAGCCGRRDRNCDTQRETECCGNKCRKDASHNPTVHQRTTCECDFCRPNNENGHRRAAQDPSTTSARADGVGHRDRVCHHDQIRMKVLRVLQYLLRRHPGSRDPSRDSKPGPLVANKPGRALEKQGSLLDLGGRPV